MMISSSKGKPVVSIAEKVGDAIIPVGDGVAGVPAGIDELVRTAQSLGYVGRRAYSAQGPVPHLSLVKDSHESTPVQ